KINLDDFFQYAFNLLIALSAVAAVFMMTWGGFEYVTTDSWQGKENGKTKFNNAIIGLLMVLSAFLILKTVNPKLVEIPASIPKVKIPSSMAESSSSILGRLVADAGRFSQETKTVLQKDMALQNDTKSAQEKIDQLNNQIKSGQLSEEEVTAAQVEMAKLQQQIDNNDTTVALDTFKINIFNNIVVNGTVSTIGAGLDSGSLSEKQIDEYINDGIDYIEQQKQLAIKRLQNRNIVQGIYGTDSIEEIAMTAKILLSLKVLDMKINSTTFTKTFTNTLSFGKLGSSIPDAHLGPTKSSNASSNNMGQANVVSQKIDNALRSLEERSIGVTSSKLKQDITDALSQTQQDYKRVYKDYLIKH
ncbi:MAG: pilin, partial [Patescibacteria group bacterium]|nr:pilin [Patescibacteria group bacterium]